MCLLLLPAAHFGFEVGTNLFKELLGRHPCLVWANEDREILCHVAVFNSLDAHFFKRFCKAGDFRRFVKLTTEF